MLREARIASGRGETLPKNAVKYLPFITMGYMLAYITSFNPHNNVLNEVGVILTIL